MPRTGSNIYKRKDGRWEGRYQKGRSEPHRIPTLADKKRDFQKPFVALSSIINSSMFPDEPPYEFEPFIDSLTLIGHPLNRKNKNKFWVKSKHKDHKNRIKSFEGTTPVVFKFTNPDEADFVYTITFSKPGL